jgi:hypothetical protein
MRSILTLTLTAFLASTLFAGTGPAPSVVINEVDADQTSTDSEEYLELFGAGGTDLTNTFLVLYNGSSDVEYEVVDLDGESIPGDGYMVIGVATVANVDLVPTVFPATNAIQNGADGIALWYDPSGALVSSDWFGTDPTTAPAGVELIDAVVYGTSDSDDVGLLAALTPGAPQVDENGNGAKDTESSGRCPDGGTPFDSGSYVQGVPTPGGPNDCPTTSAWTDEACALAGVSGDPLLVGTGDLSDGSANSADLSNAAPNATCGLFLAFSSTPTPFKGGTLKPVPFLDPLILTTSGTGDLPIPFVMPSGIPPASEIWVQWAIQDTAAIKNVSLSNAILGITP